MIAYRKAGGIDRVRATIAAGKLLSILPPLACLILAIPPVQPPPSAQTLQPPAELETPAPDPEPGPAAEESTAHSVGECIITHYDVCILCCGKTDGITASGAAAVPYETCAVDPAVIPLGSAVLVDYGDGEIHTYRAEDTGAGVAGRHIDICVTSHQEALELGVRSATVWWME